MRKVLLLTLLFALFTTLGFSQSGKYWSAHTDIGTLTPDKSAARLSLLHTSFKLFDLNTQALRQDLFRIVDRSATSSIVITLPNADGGTEEFEVFEASNFEPALQEKFPQIRAFSGKGITDKYATLKLSLSPSGIQTMVFRTEKPAEFIEAYSSDHTVYAVFASQREKGQSGWKCFTEEENNMIKSVTSRNPLGSNFTGSSAGQLKVIRLAQSCTAEYANFFGASTAGTAADQAIVLTAFNNTITRCNGVYEKDLALHLNLIGNTNLVMFFNPATDPYATVTNAGSPPGSWNSSLQNTLTANIGEANYDIGHLFGASGGGGNAGCIGCVCNNGTKGSGITSPATGTVNPSTTFPPSGDAFDIDYVVHEIGHQLGALHTFSFDAAQIGAASLEVGSGITIMAYAGIVSGANVAAHSVDYYHAFSIDQIQNNLAFKTCPVTTNITPNNATPVVGALTPYTIPVSTPFALTGTATDANAGDALTYAWEQYDAATSTSTGINSLASPTKLTGPNFADFPVNTTGIRLFPRLQSILTGASTTSGSINAGDNVNIEALSSVARTLNFRLTVRDNSPYVPTGTVKVGQTAFNDVAITVSALVGPFLITSQNSAVSYTAGSTQTVTWNIAGTTGAPTNTSNVKISWSGDNGVTFTTLIASTPNDGTESIVIPSPLITTGRIKVEAIGNIYFDINNAPITVVPAPSGFTFTTPAATTVACAGTNTATSTIATASQGGFVTPINLTVTAGLPAGVTAAFAPNPVTPGSSTVLTLTGVSTLSPGTYNITVQGVAGAVTQTVTASFIISAGAAPVITTQPASIAVCVPATATFTAASSTAGVTYQWQSATAAAPTVFTNIAGATSASYTTPATTAAMNGNIYHVIISTQCGTTTSNNATLTVNTAAAITAQPTNQPACTGNTATFSVTATGTGVTYQWYSATVAAGPYTLIPGATAATYTTPTITGSTPAFYQVIVTTTTCPGSVTSNTAQLTVSTTTAIGTQPSSVAVCAPAAATFTVAATGTGLSYQWQSATPAAPTVFTNIAGATATSYNTGATTAAMNGTVYHVVVTGSCNTVTSNNVTLTVNTAAALGTPAPAAQTVCNGTTASFTVVATGTGVTYQWQSGPSATGPFTNVSTGTGATTATYTTAATTPGMNGTYYQAVVTTTTCPATVTTVPVLLTVNTVATITTQPTNQSACIPASATFTVVATGTGLSYQWQVATAAAPTVFNNITGATGTTYSTGPTTIAMNGNIYHVLVSSTCSPGAPITSANAVLTVNNPVTVTQNPVDRSGCVGDNYTFSVTATSTGTITYQWQSSFDNITYTNISGANSSTYTVTAATILQNGTYYRVIVSGAPCGLVTTPGAKLTVSYRPTVILTAGAATATNPGQPSGLYTTVSPAGNYVYGWKRNGVVIPVLTPSLTAANGFFDDFGTYQVTVTDVTTGCTATSNTVTISDIVGERNRLFVSPNPTRDVVNVSYYNAAVTAQARSIHVYDGKGSRMMVKTYNPSGIYGQMRLDLTGLTPGTYVIELRDAAGKKLASSGVVKL